jgi:hypothetical protein
MFLICVSEFLRLNWLIISQKQEKIVYSVNKAANSFRKPSTHMQKAKLAIS